MIAKNKIIDELAPMVDKVINYSQGVCGSNSTDILNRWYDAKETLIKRMGGKLIYEFPNTISINLTENQKNLKVNEVIDRIRYNFRNEDLANFIDYNKKDFFTNKISEDYSYGDVKIPKGMKVIKAFKFFEENKNVLEAIQNYASTVIQENKITGKLCISVHPLDFLSSSENNYKWKSCHSLNGDFRAGNFSYMCDPSTIVCYIKGDVDEKLPNFPNDVKWNSKKWRMLLFFSQHHNIVFAGRQYPFFSMEALNAVWEVVDENTALLTTSRKNYSQWTDTQISFVIDTNNKRINFNPHIPFPGYLIPLESLVKDAQNSNGTILHYNDLLFSSSYTPYYCYNEYAYLKNETLIVGSGDILCPLCGNNIIENGDSLFCPCCYDYTNDDDGYTCDCCGNYCHEAVYVESMDEYLCGDCLDELCSMCEECGEFHKKEEVVYDPEKEKMICIYCKGE